MDNNSNVIGDIVLLHNNMRKLTLEAGVPKTRYESVLLDVEDFKPEEVVELYDWLNKIWNNEYRKVEDIKKLLTDEVWARYDLYKVTGLREQILLRDAKKELKLLWEQPYRSKEQLHRIASKKSPTKRKPIKD